MSTVHTDLGLAVGARALEQPGVLSPRGGAGAAGERAARGGRAVGILGVDHHRLEPEALRVRHQHRVAKTVP